MKKIILTAAVISALAGGLVAVSRTLNSNDSILKENIDALADGAVELPCRKGTGSCKFDVKDADGGDYTMTINNFVSSKTGIIQEDKD